MSIKEKLEAMELDDLCEVCRYASRCSGGGVRGGPNGPIYPYCADHDLEDFVDEETLDAMYEDFLVERYNKIEE